MIIDYDHARNRHTLEGPRVALPKIFGESKPASLLDVGCGRGTWLNAAREIGITDILGLDGVAIPQEELLIPAEFFRRQDLTIPWNLHRRFDAALCLEVAEHLNEEFGGQLVATLTNHSDTVVFSAACPGQPGQHHVNCQWPVYWQSLFNDQGYVCSDAVRWELWDDTQIEPWYRQNMFLARRDPAHAGKEPRIPSVMHATMQSRFERSFFADHVLQIENGRMPMFWYLRTFFKGPLAKVRRKLINVTALL